MINLIPPKGHTSLRHEYILRVGSMYGFILAGVFIAGTVVMIPTYVLVSSQLDAVRPINEGVEETEKIYDDALAQIQSANTIMAQLRSPASNVEISAVITEIIRVAPEGITFRTFQAAREVHMLKAFDVQGHAKTRNALAALKTALEASPLFETASIPISDLAQEKDLPFAVRITLHDTATSE